MAAKKGTTAKKTETKTAETKTQETTTEENQQAPTEGTQTEQTSEETTQTQASGDTTENKEPEVTKDPEPEKEQAKEEPKPSIDVPEGLESLAAKIDQYTAAMAPNMMVETDEILRNQLRLRSIINIVLATPAEQFNDAMKLLVKKVRAERKGAFSERLVFRGFPQIKLARSERQKLETLVSLLLATADAQQPGKVKDVVDMNVVNRYVKNDDQQQKLQSYYGG